MISFIWRALSTHSEVCPRPEHQSSDENNFQDQQGKTSKQTNHWAEPQNEKFEITLSFEWFDEIAISEVFAEQKQDISRGSGSRNIRLGEGLVLLFLVSD